MHKVSEYVSMHPGLTQVSQSIIVSSLLFGGEYIMPIEVDGEIYYTAAEAARYLHISRDTFYRNVKNKLQSYKHGALRREYFLRSELKKYSGVHPTNENELLDEHQN